MQLFRKNSKRTPIVSKWQVTQLLSKMPEETSSNFASEAREILGLLSSNESMLEKIIQDISLPNTTRFYAFYMHQVHLRRNGRNQEYMANIQAFRHDFQEHPMFLFMLAQFYSETPPPYGNNALAVKYGREACMLLPENPGVHNVFAKVLLESLEFANLRADPHPHNPELETAYTHARLAISLSSPDNTPPKFFITKARIESQMHLDSEAIMSANKALALQETSTSVGRARRNEFLSTRTIILSEAQRHQGLQEQKDAISEFKSIKGEMLSLLGLLAAVVALISTTTEIVAAHTVGDAALLLCVCGAVIILVFTSFHKFLGGTYTRKSIIPGVLVSLALFLAGLIIRSTL